MSPPGSGDSIDELADAEATLAIIGPVQREASWVVLDSYRLGHQWEARVRRAGHRLAVIEDLTDRTHDADLLVSASETFHIEPALAATETIRVLKGHKYALVNPDFAFDAAPSVTVATAKRLLISYGGSDPTGETHKTLEAARAWKLSAHADRRIGPIDVVVGPANAAAAAIGRDASGIPDVTVHHAPPGLATLLRRADLFLTAGGQSLVEALALRTPCLVTVTADNQTPLVRELDGLGVIRLLGDHAAVGAREVVAGVDEALAGWNTFARHVVTTPVFDHRGAERIADAMVA
jgi:UDP-2,4-diacetamido-2,4,6-trideoxy-beta-L-altropyranose hydrolase